MYSFTPCRSPHFFCCISLFKSTVISHYEYIVMSRLIFIDIDNLFDQQYLILKFRFLYQLFYIKVLITCLILWPLFSSERIAV